MVTGTTPVRSATSSKLGLNFVVHFGIDDIERR
jgi:hypothetical protein